MIENEVREAGGYPATWERVGNSTEFRLCSKGLENPLDDLWQ